MSIFLQNLWTDFLIDLFLCLSFLFSFFIIFHDWAVTLPLLPPPPPPFFVVVLRLPPSCLMSKSSEPGDTSPTPPASPPTFRRGGTSREENPNVFSRLTHGTNVGQEPVPDRGVVHPFQGKVKKK
jgi:hypothetical protein